MKTPNFFNKILSKVLQVKNCLVTVSYLDRYSPFEKWRIAFDKICFVYTKTWIKYIMAYSEN